MYVKMDICVEDAINELSATEKTELTRDMVKDNLDISEIVDAAKYAGYAERDILEQLDIDNVIAYVKSQGYNVED